MNDQTPTNSASDLPELSQASIDRIETAVFSEIARGRVAAPEAKPATASSKRRTRRRGWLTGLGVAAAFVAGVLLTPPLLNITTGTTAGSAGDTIGLVSDSAGGGAVGEVLPESASMDAADGAATEDRAREIIATAQATLRVDDIADAVDEIAALAEEHDGYVESTDISATDLPADTSVPAPAPEGEYGWISIRVPAADLTTVIDELGQTGTVVSSSTSQQDVTTAAIDLRARVDATRASVDRLTELMSQSGSVSELIDAEVALTDRQAQLESYTQQLAALEDQVAMSSLQVHVAQSTTVAPADPAGFADGLLAGWNGLIASLNALVIAIGFLLPWLVVAGVIAVIVWGIIRRRRRSTATEVP